MIRKKFFAWLLTAALVLGMLPAPALAEAPEVTVDSGTTAWTDGNTYIVNGTVTISDRIEVSGTVTLQLASGTLTASKGIHVLKDASLTINGSGTLKATGDDWHAGIGGNENEPGGNITINSGAINATGGFGAAGVGGGSGSRGSIGTNTIKITGGTVTAQGGVRGAGIGSGSDAPSCVGAIVIEGGTVNAAGGSEAAGIGGGHSSDVSNATVTITGGEVMAQGGVNGAGIGGGNNSPGCSCVISGSTVTAKGGNSGADIGAGAEGNGCVSIQIKDAVVNNQNCSDVAFDFTAPPQNKTVAAGKTAEFSVTASGNPAPAYQWQVRTAGSGNWTDISGATASTYTTAAADMSMNGWQYRCIASNDAGRAESSAATLTVTQVDLSGAAVTISGSYPHTGQAIEPPVTVTLNGTPLTAGTDYTVSYTNNVDIGTADVTVTGTGNYTGTANGTFTIGKAEQTAPGSGVGFTIDYTAETVTVTDNGTYELASSSTASTGVSTLNVAPGVNVYIRLKETANFAPSDWTVVTVPDRPAAPLAPLTLTKTADSITVTNSYPGCEFSKDGISWNDSGVFSGLTAGQTYSISVRTKAVANTAFASISQTINVTTVNADGSTTVKPGESAETGGAAITNDGEKIIITNGNGTTTITPPSGGGNVDVGAGGGVTVPGGSVIQTGGDDPVTVPDSGGIFDPDTGEIELNVHTVTVNGGTGGGSYTEGAAVTITATVPSGQRFTGWTVNEGGVTLANASSATTTFTMPARAVTVTASFENISAPTFLVTVNGGTGGGSYAEGAAVTITATVPSGQRFTGWTVNEGGVTLANANSATTTFTMPAQAVTVTANFQSNSGGGGGSYTPPTTTYPPTVEQPSEGGTVTVSPSRPSTGDKVTVRPKPDSGYEVEKVTVTDKNGRPVTVTKDPDGTYSFTQPNGAVKVEVIYKSTEPLWSNPFRDVTETAWYYEAVRYVSENGLMNGYSDGRFGSDDNLSRAQLAQILFNKEGRPGVNYLLDFSDVAGEAWYTEAIRWATSQGIVGGYGNGTFGPNDPITREQLAVMLWRYSGSPAATNKELHFNDTDEISPFALEALRWAVENGVLNGYGDGRLGPQGQATRAQVAQMLMNFLKNR